MTDKARLTCHVLDLTRGIPAAGMALRLSRLDGPSADVLVTTAIVPVHFGVADGTGHLHVALLVTHWSYTTYRGS